MKKKLPLFVLLLFVYQISAQVYEYTLSNAGSLKNIVNKDAKNIRINGSMDIRDFLFIRDSMNVDTIDLSNTSIAGFDGFLNSDNLPFVSNQLPEYAFKYTKIKKINLPSNLKSIGQGAFLGDSLLRDIIIPETVDSIQYVAFAECVSLPAINFPSSILFIGDYAFFNCSSLSGSITLPRINLS